MVVTKSLIALRRAKPELKLNIMANLAGRGWTAVLSLALVPVYIKLIGIESYALVGIYTTLYSLVSLLDVGLSSTLNRELARFSIKGTEVERTRNLVRTLEIVYWAISGCIALILLLLVPIFTNNWIKPNNLSPDSVRQALLLISLIIPVQFPFILYTGGLQGLQRQVLLNILLIGMATVRSLGAILVLWLISPTVQAFFIWQFVVALTQTLLSGLFLWKSLPTAAKRAHFEKALLKDIWRFAAGLTAIAFLGLILGNLDKIVLSNILPLKTFGYYTIASTVATSLYMVIIPIYDASYPHLSQLVVLKNEEGLKRSYHHSCQVIGVLVIPISLFISFFAPEILKLWINNPLVVENSHLPLSLLVIGTALNGLMTIPYALMLAYGWLKYPLYQNLVAAVVIVPLLIISANIYGMPGAAASWILLNLGYVLIGIQIMHRKLLKTEKLRWYRQDVGIPLITALSVILLGRLLFPSQAPLWIALPILGLILGLTLVATVWFTPNTGLWLRLQLSTFRKRVKV